MTARASTVARFGPSFGLLLAGLSACAHGPHHRGDRPDWQEAKLEAQLISREHKSSKRTGDGGMLFYADFDATSPEPLRVPYDTLKLQCENRGGSWTPSAPPSASAESLLPTDGSAPDAIRGALHDADQRGLFGVFSCASGEGVWTAEIQPSKILGSTGPARSRLELYLRASEGGEQSEGGEGPQLGPPPMAANPGASGMPPPPAAGPDAAPPPEPIPAKPLEPQPARPSPRGDKLLADPRPFGINLGSDSPEVFASKLRLEPGGSCGKAAPKGSINQCWQHPGASEASSLQARFVDLGAGPVVAAFDLHYPATAFEWLAKNFAETLGPADENTESKRSWTWLHTAIVLEREGDDTHVQVTHKPSLDRAQLPAGTPGHQAPATTRIATPWQLQLGYEPAQLAEAKLRAAGFSISESGCTDSGPYARPVFTRTCALRGGRMPGLRSAWVRIVDIGDGRPRLAELGYDFDNSALEDTEQELQTQYGAPIPSQGGIRQWWTGPVGITVTPAADGFGLRYFHGRLLEYYLLAAEKSRVAEKALQHQGL